MKSIPPVYVRHVLQSDADRMLKRQWPEPHMRLERWLARLRQWLVLVQARMVYKRTLRNRAS
jgi:hypothetical protein